MMTDNPINNEENIWTDALTASYEEIEEENENCCKSVHTQEALPVLITLLVLLLVCIYYLVIAY